MRTALFLISRYKLITKNIITGVILMFLEGQEEGTYVWLGTADSERFSIKNSYITGKISIPHGQKNKLWNGRNWERESIQTEQTCLSEQQRQPGDLM